MLYVFSSYLSKAGLSPINCYLFYWTIIGITTSHLSPDLIINWNIYIQNFPDPTIVVILYTWTYIIFSQYSYVLIYSYSDFVDLHRPTSYIFCFIQPTVLQSQTFPFFIDMYFIGNALSNCSINFNLFTDYWDTEAQIVECDPKHLITSHDIKD